MERNVPSRESQVTRQQSLLELRRQFQVILQGAHLLGGQAIQADPDQRVFANLLLFHRRVAGFADAEAALVDALQRVVDFFQEANHLLALALPENFGERARPVSSCSRTLST